MAGATQSSKKMRALQQTLGKPLGDIAAEYAPKPLSYAEIAHEWTIAVRREFPEHNFRFTYQDAFVLFEAYGLMRQGPRQKAQVAS